MEQVTELAAIQLGIDIDVPVERAYQVFTQRFDLIKPRDHNLLGEEIAETVLEPWVGGRVYDRGVEGAVCTWGRVLEVEPPHRLVFSWDIDPRWQLELDHSRTSEVEVRFTVVSSHSTRVELEHRNLDRHGDGWQALRDGVAGDEGWPLYLNRFADLLPGGER